MSFARSFLAHIKKGNSAERKVGNDFQFYEVGLFKKDYLFAGIITS